MIKTIMLGLVLAAVALSGVMSVTMSVASAETVPSPLQQVQNGVPIGEIVCSNDRVLMVSQTGMPACVFEESVLELKTRWMATDTVDNDNILLPYDSDLKNTKIQISTNKTTTGNMNNVDMGEVPKNIPTSDNSINYDAELMSILEKDLIFTNKNKETDLNTLSESGPFGLPEKWPIYNVTYPRTAQVGVPFNVIYNYSFAIPDEETGSYVNFNEQCSEYGCGRMHFSATVSSYVNVTSDNLEYDRDLNGGKTIPMTNRTVYEYHPEFDNTQPLEETFTFVINEPDIDYRIGQIHVQIQTSHNDDLVYFYVGEDGNIIFDPMLKKEIFEQSSLAKSDVPSVTKAASVIRTELNKLQERPGDWTTNIVYAPVGLRDGPPPELYEYFAEKVLRQYPGENFEELFIYHNFTQTWIDDFLNAMPHLKPDDSLTSQAMDFLASYMLLPLAYGAEVTTTVFGQLVNTDEDGSSVFVHGGTVCAYDRDSFGLNPIIVNNEHVCSETAQSGTFVFEVPTIDPSGSGNTDLVLKAFAKNSHFEFFLDNSLGKVKIDDNTQFDNIPTSMLDVGFFDISEQQVSSGVPIEHQHFWALDRLTDIQEWYTSNVVASTDKIYVVYDPNVCKKGAGYDPSNFNLDLSHTETEGGVDCTLDYHGNVYSPLTNQDTLAHEYGHVVFLSFYHV